MEFHGLGNRILTADFQGGDIVSDGGVPLIAQVDRMFDVMRRFALCFTDHRDQDQTEHPVLDLVRQRTYGLCLGYEDLNDHDQLRLDKLLAAAIGKHDPAGDQRRREADRGAALAGKSTLNRLELSKPGADADTQYCKIVADLDRMGTLLIDLFLDAHQEPPDEITLDIDPTDVTLHGEQWGRHFQTHYDGYCYLPQYVFCGDFLLAAQLRPGDVGAMSGAMAVLKKIVSRVRERWPDVPITVRGDGHFSDDDLMSWCESLPQVEFIVGLPSNRRLMKEVRDEQRQMASAVACASENGEPKQSCRTFKDLEYRTLDSWSQTRRVVAKVEHLPGKPGESVQANAVSAARRSAAEAGQRAAEAERAVAEAKANAAQEHQRAGRLACLADQLTASAPRDRSDRAKEQRAVARTTRKQAKRAAALAGRLTGGVAKAERHAEKLRTKADAIQTEADWVAEQSSWEGKSNVRFVIVSRTAAELDARSAYEDGYCPRGDAENRIKEQQLYLFAASLPCEQMRANQIRLYQCSFAYVLDNLLRQFGLAGTEMERAQCHTIRERLFKIGSLIQVTKRRVWSRLSSSYPYRKLFTRVVSNLRRHALELASRRVLSDTAGLAVVTT